MHACLFHARSAARGAEEVTVIDLRFAIATMGQSVAHIDGEEAIWHRYTVYHPQVRPACSLFPLPLSCVFVRHPRITLGELFAVTPCL
jgi:hypothetical protein